MLSWMTMLSSSNTSRNTVVNFVVISSLVIGVPSSLVVPKEHFRRDEPVHRQFPHRPGVGGGDSREPKLLVESTHHPVLFRSEVLSAQRGQAMLPAVIHEECHGILLDATIQNAKARDVLEGIQPVTRLLGAHDGDQAVVPRLVAQLDVEARVLLRPRH